MSNATIFEELGFGTHEGRLPEAVVYSVARTASLLASELSTVYQRFGLTPPSFNLLMLLKHGKDPSTFSQQALGRRLAVTASNMTGLIDRLEKRGFVRRTSGNDRRSKLLRITPQGATLLRQVWPSHVEAVERLTKGLDERAARTLLSVATHLRRNVTR